MKNDTTVRASVGVPALVHPSPYVASHKGENLTRYAGWATARADQLRTLTRELARLREIAADIAADDSGVGEEASPRASVMPDRTAALLGATLDAIHAALDTAAGAASALELDATLAEVHRDHFAHRPARKGSTSKRATANRRASKQTPAPVLSPAA